MKKSRSTDLSLIALLFIVLALMTAARAAFPDWILPKANFSNLTFLSLIALLLEQSAFGGAPQNDLLRFFRAAAAFGLLPLCAGMVSITEAARLAAAGGAIFVCIARLFFSAQDWLSSAPTASRAAGVLCALGLYCAAQGFSAFL